jgi:hypothetical protein
LGAGSGVADLGTTVTGGADWGDACSDGGAGRLMILGTIGPPGVAAGAGDAVGADDAGAAVVGAAGAGAAAGLAGCSGIDGRELGAGIGSGVATPFAGS